MKWSSAVAVGAIAILGIVAAAGMGLLANAISGDSIGLSAQPLRAGSSLAPAQAEGDRDHAATTTSTTESTTSTTGSTTSTTDDRGGQAGPGDDSPGSTVSPGSEDSGESSGSDD